MPDNLYKSQVDIADKLSMGQTPQSGLAALNTTPNSNTTASSMANTSPSSSTNINSLQAKKQTKINFLSGYKKDTLLGMQDADSLITANTPLNGHIQRLGRTTLLPNSYSYDAAEVVHLNRYGHKVGVDPLVEDQTHKYKAIQIPYVAKKLGISPSAVTSQDIQDVGNQQTIQKLADLSGHSNWKAPLIRNSVPINLTGQYVNDKGNPVNIPLDIPITSKNWNKAGFYGRELMSYGTASGTPVTVNAAIDPTQNVDYVKARETLKNVLNGVTTSPGNQQSSLAPLDQAMQAQKRLDAAGYGNGVPKVQNEDGYGVEVAKNAASTVVSSIGEAANAVFNDAPDWLVGKSEELYYNHQIANATSPAEKTQLEAAKQNALAHSHKMSGVASWMDGNGYNDTKQYYTDANIKHLTDNLFGVNRLQSQREQNQLEADIKNGNYGKAALKAVTSGSVIGNLGGSILTFILGAGEVKAGTMVAEDGSKLARIYEKVADLLKTGDAEKASKLAKIASKRMTLGQKILAKGLQNAGATAMFTSITDSTLAARNKAEGQKYASLKDLALTIPSAFLQTYAGLGSAKIITTPIESALKDSASFLSKKETDGLWLSVLKRAGRMVGTTGKGMATGGVENYLQQWAGILGMQWDTGKKGDDLQSIIANKANQVSASVAGIEGMSSGYVAAATQGAHELGDMHMPKMPNILKRKQKNNPDEPISTEVPATDTASFTKEPVTKADFAEGGLFGNIGKEYIAVTHPDITAALNKHLKAVQEGVPLEDKPSEDSPILDKDSRDYILNTYNKAISSADNVINNVNEKISNGTHTKKDLVNRDKAITLILEAETLKNRYFGKSKPVLGNRPLPDIQSDIDKIQNKTTNGKLTPQDEYQLNLLKVEKELATNFETGIEGNNAINKTNADSTKENEVLHMILYGGRSEDGQVKTGIMDYAKMLLNPDTSETTKNVARESLNSFMAKSNDKFETFKHAKDNPGEPHKYNNGNSTFVYHPVKDGENQSSSEPFYQRALKEHTAITKIADTLLSGDISNLHENDTKDNSTSIHNDNETYVPPWHSTSYSLDDPVGLSIAKDVIIANMHDGVLPDGQRMSENQRAEFTAVNPKLIKKASKELESNTAPNYSTQINSHEFNDYAQTTTGEPVNTYDRAKNGEIPTISTQLKESNNAKQNETSSNEGTKRTEQPRPTREETVNETQQSEDYSKQAPEETTPVDKAKQLVSEATRLTLYNKTKPNSMQVESNNRKIEAFRNSVDSILEHLYNTKEYNGVSDILKEIDSIPEGFEHTKFSAVLDKIIKLHKSVQDTKKEINKVETEIKENDKVIPRMLNASWDVLQHELSAYKKMYINAAKRYKWIPDSVKAKKLTKVYQNKLTKDINNKLGKNTVTAGKVKANDKQQVEIVKQKVLGNKDKIQQVIDTSSDLTKKKDKLNSNLNDLQYELSKQKDVAKPNNKTGEDVFTNVDTSGIDNVINSIKTNKDNFDKGLAISEDDLAIIKALETVKGCK